MFEEKKSHGFSNNKILEEGLLEKIISLSLMNLYIFRPEPLDIIALKSPKARQKLFMLSNNQKRILDAAVVLIILADAPVGFDKAVAERARHWSDLLIMSLMYAAKCYAVDFYPVDGLDLDSLKENFQIGTHKDIMSVACLGYFDDCSVSYAWENRRFYHHMVKEI